MLLGARTIAVCATDQSATTQRTAMTRLWQEITIGRQGKKKDAPNKKSWNSNGCRNWEEETVPRRDTTERDTKLWTNYTSLQARQESWPDASRYRELGSVTHASSPQAHSTNLLSSNNPLEFGYANVRCWNIRMIRWVTSNRFFSRSANVHRAMLMPALCCNEPVVIYTDGRL